MHIKYYCYILRCADGTLYTGWTTDLEKRLAAHNAGKGAKYTRSRRPVELVYSEAFEDPSGARRRECAIKQLTRGEKEKLISGKTKKTERKIIHVAAAILLDGESRIFATQRGYGEWKDYWEFPGGKIEPGETPEEALIREIREELDSEIAVDEKLTTVEYDYPAFHLSMDCFLAHVIEGKLVLKEHEAARWLGKNELDSVDWLPADRGVIKLLKQRLL